MTAPNSSLPSNWPSPWQTALAQPVHTPQQRKVAAGQVRSGLKSTGTLFKTLLRRLLNVAIMLVLLIGAGTLWDATVGDGRMPVLNQLKGRSYVITRLVRQNSTAQLPPSLAQQSYWQAMTSSRQLLLTLSPQIALWLENLHQEGHIVAGQPEDIQKTYHVSQDTPLLAAYRYGSNRLYLGDAFWRLSDGEKVVVLVHEYRHSRQNPGKRISYQLAQWLGMGHLKNESSLEDEARAYELQAAHALGLD